MEDILIQIPFRIRLQLFLLLSLSILVVFLFSCREKTAKKTFSEDKGFDTPVQGQVIKMPEAHPARGLMVGIAKPGENSYFIKLTGPRENMVKVKENFVKFSESLVLQ